MNGKGTKFVTREELAKEITELKGDVKEIKTALLGTNFNSGLIKTVNDNCNKITNIKTFCAKVQQEKDGKSDSNFRLKLALVGVGGSALTSFLLWLAQFMTGL